MLIRRLLGIFIIFAIFLAYPNSAYASLFINEISPSGQEWVELYNDGDSSQDLTGYLLKDGNSSDSDDLILSGTIIGKGYLVFEHSDGWLNNSGDTVTLYNNASPSAILDQHTYGNVDSSHSTARSPDGSENWIVTGSFTKNSSNPTPTPSQLSTISPTNSPTSSPTSTPSPTKSPTPKPTVKPTAKPTLEPSPEVLASETTEPTPSPTSTPTESKTKFPVVAIAMIFLGIVSIGAAFFPFLKAKLGEYNESHGKNP